MKHEALTEAISMLDDSLIAEAQQPFRRRRAAPVLSRWCAAAAACAAVVGAFLLLPKGGEADLLIMGQDPSAAPVAIAYETPAADSVGVQAAAVRAFSLELTDIPVELKAAGKTTVSVSGGELYISDSTAVKQPADIPLELDGNASLVWSVPLFDCGESFRLTAQSAGNCQILLLYFDEDSQQWTIKQDPAK